MSLRSRLQYHVAFWGNTTFSDMDWYAAVQKELVRQLLAETNGTAKLRARPPHQPLTPTTCKPTSSLHNCLNDLARYAQRDERGGLRGSANACNLPRCQKHPCEHAWKLAAGFSWTFGTQPSMQDSVRSFHPDSIRPGIRRNSRSHSARCNWSQSYKSSWSSGKWSMA